MLGPFATASRYMPFTRCRYCRMPPLSHAACASMSTTTTTTTTTRDRGDRYGPIEWAQLLSTAKSSKSVSPVEILCDIPARTWPSSPSAAPRKHFATVTYALHMLVCNCVVKISQTRTKYDVTALLYTTGCEFSPRADNNSALFSYNMPDFLELLGCVDISIAYIAAHSYRSCSVIRLSNELWKNGWLDRYMPFGMMGQVGSILGCIWGPL